MYANNVARIVSRKCERKMRNLYMSRIVPWTTIYANPQTKYATNRAMKRNWHESAADLQQKYVAKRAMNCNLH